MKKVLAFLAGTAILATSVIASAQADPTDVRARNAWAARNLTPNVMELQILAGPTSVQALSIAQGGEFGLNIHRHDYGFGNDVSVGMPLGVAFGVIDNLEVGLALPLQFKPGAFGDMPIWATYQFKNGPFQIGARLALYLPTNGTFQIQAGLPMMLRTGSIRLETGFFAHFRVQDFGGHHTFFAPLRVGFQIMPELYAGVQTAVNVHLRSGGGSSNALVQVPLYGFVGYTLAGGLGPIDLGFRFGFDQFVTGGGGNGAHVDGKNFSFAMGANIGLQF